MWGQHHLTLLQSESSEALAVVGIPEGIVCLCKPAKFLATASSPPSFLPAPAEFTKAGCAAGETEAPSIWQSGQCQLVQEAAEARVIIIIIIKSQLIHRHFKITMPQLNGTEMHLFRHHDSMQFAINSPEHLPGRLKSRR